jgi:hypothetical protein
MSDPKAIGIGFFHQFYTPRNLLFMSTFKSKLGSTRLLGPLTSSALVLSKMYRFRSQNGSLGAGGGPMNGTLYVPSLIKEIPASKTLKEHVEKSVNMRAGPRETYALIQTSSFTNCPQVPSNSLDYLFLDPPFGANLMYSELNFIWECWLLVKTHTEHEAIENRTQLKTNKEYRYLMMRCFSEAFRILKPGRRKLRMMGWMRLW